MRLRWLAAAVVLMGCHHRLPKLSEAGRHDEVVQRVQGSRILPRKKAARAYARSLQALGRSQQAIDALMLDYRRGGQIPSLVALADLELTLGWRGLAAHHYTRVMTLDRDALRSRPEVCGLFVDRARAYIDAGEGEAADADVRRMAYLCPDVAAKQPQLVAEADAAAQALVDARIETSRCPVPCEAPQSASTALEDRLEESARVSTVALAKTSAEIGAQLAPKALIATLLADARGELAPTLLDDDTVRKWVGDQTWADLAPGIMTQEGPSAAYLQLRLAPVLDDLPRAPGAAGVQEIDRWISQAVRVPGVQAWRVYAGQGDVSTAELDLRSVWRPAKPEAAPQGDEADSTRSREVSDEAPTRVEHWSQRLTIGSSTFAPALTAARLRAASGKADLSLTLMRRALSEAEAARLPQARDQSRDAAIRALGWGRPWHALALLNLPTADHGGVVRAAAATAILLADVTCGPDGCRDDEDFGVVLRVMGESWVAEQRAQLSRWSSTRLSGVEADASCPTLAEVLDPLDPTLSGPLPEALREARADLDGPAVGDALANAIAADLRGWCAGRLALPVMVEGQHRLSAARLSDLLAHVPEQVAASDLANHAKLAMVADEPERAQLLAVAAGAASADPAATWRDLGRFAAFTGMRNLELQAWREVLMVTPSVHNAQIEARLVTVALEDIRVSWGQDRAAGEEATQRHVTSMLERLPRAVHWSATEALLAQALHSGVAKDMDRAQRVQLIVALTNAPADDSRHARAVARLLEEDPGEAHSELHSQGLADDVTAGRIRKPSSLTIAFADPIAFEPTRIALAANARDWGVRRRMAVSLIALGSARARWIGWHTLLEMAVQADPQRRATLESRLVHRPNVLEPGAPYTSPRATALFDDSTSLRAILGLGDGPGPLP